MNLSVNLSQCHWVPSTLQLKTRGDVENWKRLNKSQVIIRQNYPSLPPSLLCVSNVLPFNYTTLSHQPIWTVYRSHRDLLLQSLVVIWGPLTVIWCHSLYQWPCNPNPSLTLTASMNVNGSFICWLNGKKLNFIGWSLHLIGNTPHRYCS